MKIAFAVVFCLAALPVRTDDDMNKLAVELARSVMTAEQFKASMSAMVEQSAQSLPDTPEGARDEFKIAMAKILPSYEESIDFTAGLLVKYYDRDELKELAAFYRSPLGQKSIKIMPELQRDSMGFMTERLQRELPKMIKAISSKHPKK